MSHGLIPDDSHDSEYAGRAYQTYNGTQTKSPQTKNPFIHAHDPKQIELLNTLLDLQSLNIDNDDHFDLPQIIVCGSQSAGKSSVLEAITEIPFPRSGNTCTRFVTKVTLRPGPKDLVEVMIQQADPQSKYPVPQFEPIVDLKDLSTDLQKQFDLATAAILGNQGAKTFSRDVLSITISGRDRPILQILDLPGLIQHDPSDKNNPRFVEDMVAAEMRKKHSTILAVVPATADFKNQRVLALCEDHDGKGKRTLGVITRPDAADPAQIETCMAVVKGMNKNDVKIAHDWHVLRNRNSDEVEKGTNTEDRDEAEKQFFREKPWVDLGAENLGVATLRTRLSKILLHSAKSVFSKLAETSKAQLIENEAELDRIGGNNMDPNKRRNIFYEAAESLKNRTDFYVEGRTRYDTTHLEPSHPINLRSRVVEQSELFRDRIMNEGHAYASQLEPSGINPDDDLRSHIQESRVSKMDKLTPDSKACRDEIEEAKKHLDEKRGMELPGNFDPHNINDFFWKRSNPWNGIADEHIGKVFEHCQNYFKHAIDMAFAPDNLKEEKATFSNHEKVAKEVFKLVCIGLDKMKIEAKKELKRIEIDRTKNQLNFNPKYLAEYRQQRNARNAKRAINAVIKDAALQNKDSRHPVPELNPNNLAELQGRHTQKDRTEEEAEDQVKSAWIQYKFMRDCYIANVVTQVIERHFMRGLSKITPDVRLLSDDDFQKLVEVDKKAEAKAKKLKRDNELLQKCLDILQQSRWS